MNSFHMQCIGYLLVNGWVQDDEYYNWWHPSNQVGCETIGAALDTQLEWDDGD